jgi:hypothetical protein
MFFLCISATFARVTTPIARERWSYKNEDIMKLPGKKALITGGNSGIGLATARLFSETLAGRTASDTRGRYAWLRRLSSVLVYEAYYSFSNPAHYPPVGKVDHGVCDSGHTAHGRRETVLQRHGRGLPTGCVRHANVSLLLQNIGSTASRFPPFFNLFALCSSFGNQRSRVSFDPVFGRAVRPIRSRAVADTLASTCDARRFRSAENLVSPFTFETTRRCLWLKCSSLEGSCGISTHRFNTARRFSVFGRARILA